MSLKMTVEHYGALKNTIAAIPLDRVAAICKAINPLDLRIKDLNKRARHDIMNAARRPDWDSCDRKINNPRISFWISDVLYTYLDDSHIDSALRRIVTELFGTNDPFWIAHYIEKGKIVRDVAH